MWVRRRRLKFSSNVLGTRSKNHFGPALILPRRGKINSEMRTRSSRLLRRDTVAARLIYASRNNFLTACRELAPPDGGWTLALHVIPELFNRGSYRRLFFRVIVGLFISLLSSPAFALPIPEKPEHYVNDYISLLSSESREKMETTLAEFEKANSTQVVVAIFDSLEGGSLEDFSIRLAEQWKIGGKEKDNGVMLLIFKSDRKVRIEVGYGLEGALPDVTANQIIQNEIVPNFREGNYDVGVEKAVDGILRATRGEYAATIDDEKINSFKPVLFVLMLIFIIIVLERSKGRTYSGRGGPFIWWGGGGSSGRGWGGGGFGGGGGGSFGGGGSSGSW